MELAIDIAVEHGAWAVVPDLEGLTRRAVAAAITQSDSAIQAGAELSLVLCDDMFIQTLNKTWRGKDKPTNVLSFPTDEPALLGDIIIAYETSAREADEEGKTLADHLTHLIVHGFLHLLGFDHEDEDEAQVMERLEGRILMSIGIASPYTNTDLTEPALDAKDRRTSP